MDVLGPLGRRFDVVVYDENRLVLEAADVVASSYNIGVGEVQDFRFRGRIRIRLWLWSVCRVV